MFSDTYLYIDAIYCFYYLNHDKLYKKPNQKEIFGGYMKYFYYYNALVKQYKLNNEFLFCNITKLLNMNFYATHNDYMKLNNLIREININKTNI